MAKSPPGGFRPGFHGPGSKPAPQPADKTFTEGYNPLAGEPKPSINVHRDPAPRVVKGR